MIDFRYHLVSLIAVFLALTVGIVVGTAALNGPVQDALTGDVERLSSDKRALERDVEELRTHLDASDRFALEVAPRLVAGSLEDRRVLLVTTAGAPSDLAERLTPVLGAAGARVTGTLQLLPALSDASSGALVDDLVAQVVPAGVELPDGEPTERATAELAAALVRPQAGAAVDLGEAQAVVSAFEEADLVTFDPAGDALEQASLAIVLTGTQPDDAGDDAGGSGEQSWQRQQQSLLSLVAELDARSDGAVVAGALGSTADEALVHLVRDAPAVAGEVSSVDNADRGTGLVAVVLALAQEAAGRTGQYGARGGAGVVPAPATS